MTMFTVAGVSVFKLEVKVRFCSDLVLRVKNLHKQGDVDIKLVDLPTPMSKYDACQYLIDSGMFNNFINDIVLIQGKKVPKSAIQKVTAPKVVIDHSIDTIRELAEV